MDRSQRFLLAALALTLVMALLPDPWLGKAQDIAGIVNFPLSPMRDGVNALTRMVKPTPRVRMPELQEQSVDALAAEVEQWRRKYRALQIEMEELEAKFTQLSMIPPERVGTVYKPLLARITGANPSAPLDGFELNRGQRHGVAPGTIAITDGVHLVGRVIDANAVRSVVVPIASESTGLIRARVIPAGGGPDLSIEDAARVQLVPDERGGFVAELAGEHVVSTGDRVIYDDEWPAAQAMIIGLVDQVAPKDESPLHTRIAVTPMYRLHELDSVILLVELPEQPREPGPP